MPTTTSKSKAPRENTQAATDPLSRVPPHSIDAEQALLACCILEGGQETVTSCIEAKIKPDAFFKPAHQVMFQAIMELYADGAPVDEVILGERLHAKGQLEDIGGFPYINEVTSRIDTPAHLPHYLERVRDLYLMRRVIRTSMESIEKAYTAHTEVDQFLEHVEQSIFQISEDRISDSAKSISESVDQAVALINQMAERKGEITGVSTGLIDLDKMTFGLHGGEMIVVAARPSMGKTCLGLNVTEAALFPKNKEDVCPTLIFSLEMGADQLAMRLLCSHARADMLKLKEGTADQQMNASLVKTAKALKKAPLWIDDSMGVSILEMRAKARRLHAQKALGLVVVDYLQLVSGTDPRVPREQQIAEISRGMKAMAKELNVPVIVLSQLNRDSEKERRQPRLSDLRESGSIEQDADVVLLISRAKDSDPELEAGEIVVPRELILAKQRNGPVGSIPVVFHRRLTRFDNFIAHDH